MIKNKINDIEAKYTNLIIEYDLIKDEIINEFISEFNLSFPNNKAEVYFDDGACQESFFPDSFSNYKLILFKINDLTYQKDGTAFKVDYLKRTFHKTITEFDSNPKLSYKEILGFCELYANKHEIKVEFYIDDVKKYDQIW